jgi:hypothetical protein
MGGSRRLPLLAAGCAGRESRKWDVSLLPYDRESEGLYFPVTSEEIKRGLGESRAQRHSHVDTCVTIVCPSVTQQAPASYPAFALNSAKLEQGSNERATAGVVCNGS